MQDRTAYRHQRSIARWYPGDVVLRLSTLIVVVAAAGPVWADPAGAETLERAAETLATGGDFLGAATKYREAYRENPRPDLMCNVGVAYYKAKDLPRSHRYLDQCVATGGSLDPAFITNVKTVLAAVEQKLLEGEFKPLNFIIQPPSATTTFASGAHDEPLVGSRQVWVPFGTYHLTIHAEGFTDRVLDINADNRERGEYSVKLEASAATPVTPEPTPPTPLPVVPAPRPERRSLVAPITASALSGVAAGVALGFYFAARSSAAEANKTDVTLAEYESHSDAASSRKYIAWGVGAGAGVAAIVAGVLWWRAYRSPSRVEVSASAASASVSLVGRW